MLSIWISIALLAIVFVVFAMGKLEGALIALLGAVAALELRLISQEHAFAAIDWNTIFLLIGMMIVVGIAKRTGIFQYLAIKAAKLARGRPVLILIFLNVVTAIVSAFLDNVTTVLLIAPVTILVADSLELNPFPFLLCEVIASNIGGTATLIGDPPNIMIASAAKLSFNSFIVNLAPVILCVLGIFIGLSALLFRKELKTKEKLIARIMELDEKKTITDMRLTRICIGVFIFAIVGFVFHERLHLQPATIALTSAAVLMFLSRIPVEEIFKEIQWSTIFLFIGLFVVVAAVAEQNVFGILSHKLFIATQGHVTLMSMAVLWGSTFASALFGAVPFVATMIPLLHEIAPHIAGGGMVLWWALALGACLGGNGTLTGAAANLVVSDIARQHGIDFTYRRFVRYGFAVAIISVAICAVYLLIRYL
jgi:Na+/H+ antiporter NhaD/arsenite permease-like protein